MADELVQVPTGRTGGGLNSGPHAQAGRELMGLRNGAVVIPQWVGGSPGPMESEMPGARSVLNQNANALAVP